MTTGIGLNCNHTGASTNRPRLANEKEIVNSNFMELNETNFDREVLNAMQPVLVEFWAGWSEASKAMAPLLENFVKDDAISRRAHPAPVQSRRLAGQNRRANHRADFARESGQVDMNLCPTKSPPVQSRKT